MCADFAFGVCMWISVFCVCVFGFLCVCVDVVSGVCVCVCVFGVRFMFTVRTQTVQAHRLSSAQTFNRVTRCVFVCATGCVRLLYEHRDGETARSIDPEPLA